MYGPYPDITWWLTHIQVSWQYTMAFPSQNILTVPSTDILTLHSDCLISRYPDMTLISHLHYPDIVEVVLSSWYYTLAIPSSDILTLPSDCPISRYPDITQWLQSQDIFTLHRGSLISRYPDITWRMPRDRLQISWHYTAAILALRNGCPTSRRLNLTQWPSVFQISWHLTLQSDRLISK